MVLPKCRDCKKKHSLPNIVCQFCAKNSKESNSVYTCPEKLNKHLELMHKESLELNVKSEVIEKSKNRIACDICNKYFPAFRVAHTLVARKSLICTYYSTYSKVHW